MKTKTMNHAAMDSYTVARRNIEEKLAKIKTALRKHQSAAGLDCHYGHVGDLTECTRLLNDALNALRR